MAEPALSLRALTRSFDAVTVVDALTFDVSQGELFGIVGPDGAGKTTTLRMLAGVLPPSAGDALIEGTSVARTAEQVKPHIAYMAQRFGQYEDLTVIENILFYADLYGVPRAERRTRLERLWEFSRLKPFQDRLAGRLSGGMKQKLGLCCALIHHPRVLLLDEPTFGVDPVSRRDLWLILHELVADGMTVVVSTSYLDEAERCDRIAMLASGRVLALDTPVALQRSFARPLFALRADVPRAARDLLRQRTDVRTAVLFGDAVHVTLTDEARWDEIASALTHAGIRILAAAPAAASLEDVFIGRIGGNAA